MNRKILTLACLVMLVTAFSGCTSSDGDKDMKTTKESNAEQKKESDSNNYFETMTDLMDRGKSMKCTYTQEVNGGETANGVVYMANGNARTEITLSTGKMYAIIDQEHTYSWIEGSSKGYKMTLEAAEMDAKMKNKVSDLAKEIDFECKSWRKDNSKFKVPTKIIFEDLSEMMDGFDVGKAMDEIENIDTDKMICDLCKNAPASEMEECLGDVVCD